jgi:hypothetical protein
MFVVVLCVKWWSRVGWMVRFLSCLTAALSGVCTVMSELIAQRLDENGLLPGMGSSFVFFGIIEFLCDPGD